MYRKNSDSANKISCCRFFVSRSFFGFPFCKDFCVEGKAFHRLNTMSYNDIMIQK
jgi:hypothetical protein